LTIVALVSSGLVPFGFNVLVGRRYGGPALGELSVALSVALFLGQIPGTMSSAATKYIAESLGGEQGVKARSVFQFLLVLSAGFSLLVGVALVIAAPFVGAVLKISTENVYFAAALVPTYTLYLYFKSVYYGVQRVRSYLMNELISDVAFFAALGAIVWLNVTPWLLLPFVINNGLFAVIALRFFMPVLHGFDWGRRCDRLAVLKYCVINGSGTAASLGRWSLGIAIAGLFLSHQSVGLFAAALTITAPLPLLPRAISLVTFATMARLHGAGQHASVRSLLQQSTEWLVFLLGLPFGLAIINASMILSVIFRPQFAAAALAAQLIMLGAFLTDTSRPSIDALSSTEYVRIPTLASFVGLAVSLVMWFGLIPIYGINAAALGFAVGALVTGGIPAYYAYRHIGTRPVVFIRPVAMLLLLLVLMTAAGRFALLASVIFVVGLSALYFHLVQDLIRASRQQYLRRKTGLANGSA
jgi:O-antigen/teichoic acid export membrane protein